MIFFVNMFLAAYSFGLFTRDVLDLTAVCMVDKFCSTYVTKTCSIAYIIRIIVEKIRWFIITVNQQLQWMVIVERKTKYTRRASTESVWFGEHDIIDVSRKVTTYNVHLSFVARLAEKIQHASNRKKDEQCTSFDNSHNGCNKKIR